MEMVDRRAAGELLRATRRRHGVSQRSLALRAGTKQATISRIERGLEQPTLRRLRQLFLVLGEELEVEPVPLATGRAPTDLRAERGRSMSERLEDGFRLASFASSLAGQVRR